MKDKLILGTAQFGKDYGINNSEGQPDFKQIRSILDFAHLQKIRILDTAEAYGNSQEIIGKYHKLSPIRFDVITKFSPTRTDLSSKIYERVISNIETLGVDYLYCYMFHTYEDYNAYFARYQSELCRLKEDSKIMKVGVSLHSNSDIEKVISNPNIDLLQLPFNLLDNSSQRKDILTKAKNSGIEIHTRSVFLQGLFFKDLNELSGNLVNLETELKKVHYIAQRNNINELALNYALSKDYIDFVTIGIDNENQLINNLNAISTNSTNDLFPLIDEIRVKNNSLLNPAIWSL